MDTSSSPAALGIEPERWLLSHGASRTGGQPGAEPAGMARRVAQPVSAGHTLEETEPCSD
jgi:hypothetical protein